MEFPRKSKSATLTIKDEDDTFRPMLLRPKRPNAADQLYEDQQAKYDNMAKASRPNIMEDARRRNPTHPKLREGLRRRKYSVKVSWTNLAEFDPSCTCTEKALLQKLKRRNTKRRKTSLRCCQCNRGKPKSSKNGRNDRCRGVTKAKSKRQKYKMYNFAYIVTDSGCQTGGPDKPNMVDRDDDAMSVGSYRSFKSNLSQPMT